MNLLGQTVPLVVDTIGPHGAFLVDPEDDATRLLLPGGEIPIGTREGDLLDVFVCLDSEERPIATTKRPKIELGDVAFLTVTTLAQFGAFVDWGLGKELLVPFAEQTCDLHVGDRHPIGLYLDESGRLAGTMRVREMLRTPDATDDFSAGEWLVGEAWRKEPGRGIFVIVERGYLGLLPEGEAHDLNRGDTARFRVSRVHPDGKIELSLRAPAHEEAVRDADAILAAVDSGGAPLNDGAGPEEIRERFGLSRKAFKRAVGALLRRGEVTIAAGGRITRPTPRPNTLPSRPPANGHPAARTGRPTHPAPPRAPKKPR